MSPEELEILVKGKSSKEKVEDPPLEEQLIQIVERKNRALAALGLSNLPRKEEETKNKIGF